MDARYTILVVCGSENKDIVGELLANDGYEAVYADTGDNAFKFMETVIPDLIMTDVTKPEFNGFEFLDKLQCDAALSKIPVFFIVSAVNGADIDKGFKFGADDYVFKPFNRSELLARIKTHIRLKACNDTLTRISEEISKANMEQPCAGTKLEFEALLNDVNRAIQTDFMTGLGNRRYMINKIENEAVRARTMGGTFAVLLADLDHFKNVNDTYGHDCGDEVLKSVANTFSCTLRSSDYVSRWGGEEFMFLVTDVNCDSAILLGERLRERIEKTPVFYNGERVDIKTTIGVAYFDPDKDTAHDVIKRADSALYHGKNNGRNQVVVF